MLERIDEISDRLLTFFLSPILNFIILSIIYSKCFGDKTVSLLSYISNLLSSIDISRIFHDYYMSLVESFPQIFGPASLSAASGIASYLIFFLSIGLILMVFLIDRLLYAVGWFLPPDVEFDFAYYQIAKINGQRVKHLYDELVAPAEVKFSDAYGIIRSYLGEQSEDKFRDAFRAGTIKAVSKGENYIATQRLMYGYPWHSLRFRSLPARQSSK